jgi:hypothetical protein
MYKLYDIDGKEVTVETNIDRVEYIKSGHYFDKDPKGKKAMPKEEKVISFEEEKKSNSKPRRRGM